MMLNHIVAASEVVHHVEHELPFNAWWFGIIAFTIFVGLLGVTVAFRSVGTRH